MKWLIFKKGESIGSPFFFVIFNTVCYKLNKICWS